MEWNPTWEDPLTSYVKQFDRLMGDQRTHKTFGEVVKGIIGGEEMDRTWGKDGDGSPPVMCLPCRPFLSFSALSPGVYRLSSFCSLPFSRVPTTLTC